MVPICRFCWLFLVRLGLYILLFCCILLCGILCVCLGIVGRIWHSLGGVLLGILGWFVGVVVSLLFVCVVYGVCYLL